MDFSTIALVIFVCYLIYKYFKRTLNFFKDLGIPYLPGWPIFGNMAGPVFQQRHFIDVIHDMYNVDQEAKYVGAFDFTQPIFVLRDLELIKDVGIKHFDNFPDHLPFGDENLDPLFGGNLFNLQGNRWKEARSVLSPSFTSSKMKMMFHLMDDCAKNIVRFMEEQSDEVRKMIDSKDIFSKYASDVIASCAFGISIDSLKNPHNKFYTLGREVTNMQSILGLKMFLSRIFPNVLKFFKIRLFSEQTANFFTDLVSNAIKIREEKGITRPDMIQMMMDARGKENYYKLDINEMTSQAFVFFFAGFETSTTSACIVAHELAINPDVQKKLQNEVDEVMSNFNGNPTYEAINGMLYLDATMNEISRMYGQGSMLDRVCKIPYTLPPALPGLNPITLQPGMRLIIPGAAIHRDPKYYDNPNEFNPDRYYQKKITINDATNLNFGIGPRSCIGNRFALMEMKILIVYLLAKFNLQPNERTCIPLKFSKKGFSNIAEGGFWISMVPRKNTM